MDEDEILHWLLSHLENDEIEDIDEDTLERMVKEGRTMAVLFCKLLNKNFEVLGKWKNFEGIFMNFQTNLEKSFEENFISFWETWKNV